jgi:GDP/UDP-N,N'-diacetylbacillosamine 2-epimerase (hydrolysing)
MTKNICVVTGSRAEYGLLRPLLLLLRADNEISLQLVVTGSHLSGAFGSTQSEIVSDGFEIHNRIEIPLKDDSKAEMAKTTGYALSAFAGCFKKIRPDLLVVLGDRYEIFAAAAAAAILGIAIAHISGGDLTEGSLDDIFRHCITKMSFLHFPGCQQSAKRIIQLGEEPERVFNVGEPGVENCLSVSPMSLPELQKDINIDITHKSYSIVTFHAATMEKDSAETQVSELITALEAFPDMDFIITKANADAGGRAINSIWDEQKRGHSNWLVVSSLGVDRYISAMKYAQMIIGNSSSGIFEAPAMKTPTVNIGDRQKGRMTADSVICCAPVAKDIINAMKRALSPEFKDVVANVLSPYGEGHTSQLIFGVIRKFLTDRPDSIKKEFYDLERKCEEHCDHPRQERV